MIRDQTTLDDLLSRTRRFVRDVAIPNEDRVEREDRVAPDLVAEMRKLGSFGWSIPKSYGGSELTTEELALAFIELSQCSVAFRVVGAQNAGIGSECLIRDGTEVQKQKYLPRLASGEMIGCLALTEIDAGSDATALQTRARQVDGGDYVINGAKRYITLAPIADLYTVFARTDDSTRGAAGVSAFLIEAGTPGLTASAPTPKMGQEGAPIGEVYLRDCRVPESAIIGGVPGQGFKTVMKALNKQRINLRRSRPALRSACSTRPSNTRASAGSPATPSANISWCRRCSPNARWRLKRHARSFSRRRASVIAARTSPWTFRCANISRPRCAAVSPTASCRFWRTGLRQGARHRALLSRCARRAHL